MPRKLARPITRQSLIGFDYKRVLIAYDCSKRPKSHPSFAPLKWWSQVGWLDTKMSESCVTCATQYKIDSAERRQLKQMAEKLGIGLGHSK